MKKETRLYNVFFPIWLLLLFFPIYRIAVLPVNFIVDLLVIVITLRILHADDIKLKARKSILKVWLFGFIADIIGGIMMISVELVDNLLQKYAAENIAVWWYQNITYNAEFSPFSSIYAFLWVLFCAALSGVLIYLFNIKFGLKKTITDPTERHKVALALAVFTAPYTFFIPTPMVG